MKSYLWILKDNLPTYESPKTTLEKTKNDLKPCNYFCVLNVWTKLLIWKNSYQLKVQ